MSEQFGGDPIGEGDAFGKDNPIDQALAFSRSPAGIAAREAQEEQDAIDRQKQIDASNVARAEELDRGPGRIAGLGRSLLDAKRIETVAVRRGFVKPSRVGEGLFFDPLNPEHVAREQRGVTPGTETGTFLQGTFPRRTLLGPNRAPLRRQPIPDRASVQAAIGFQSRLGVQPSAFGSASSFTLDEIPPLSKAESLRIARRG